MIVDEDSGHLRNLVWLDAPARSFYESFRIYAIRTVNPVLNGHSKIDKTMILMTNAGLMKVKSITECSNTFDLIGLKNQLWSSVLAAA